MQSVLTSSDENCIRKLGPNYHQENIILFSYSIFFCLRVDCNIVIDNKQIEQKPKSSAAPPPHYGQSIKVKIKEREHGTVCCDPQLLFDYGIQKQCIGQRGAHMLERSDCSLSS